MNDSENDIQIEGPHDLDVVTTRGRIAVKYYLDRTTRSIVGFELIDRKNGSAIGDINCPVRAIKGRQTP